MPQSGEFGFLALRTPDDLAAFLDVPLSTLTMFAYKREKDFYRHFTISKRSGGSRTIDAPTGSLLNIQRKLSDSLYEVYKAPDCAHGFVPKKSIATNAVSHVGHPVLLNLDLKDFFPSITAARIHGLFSHESFGFSPSLVNLLTNLVCYNGRLPQGSPTSPVLSNMICMNLDAKLTDFCYHHKLYYTRYADDIVISSTSKRAMQAAYSDSERKVSKRIEALINKAGFQINNKKTHIAYRSDRHTVNGIVVNRKCNYPREEYRSLRVLFHNWETKGWEIAARQYADYLISKKLPSISFLDESESPIQAVFVSHVRGRLDFYSMIDSKNKIPSTSLTKLWDRYRRLTGEKVPRAFAEDMVMKTSVEYSTVDDDGLPADVIESGSGFVSKNGVFITCRHCLIETYKHLQSNSDTLVNLKRGNEPICSIDINDFDYDYSADLAILRAPELLGNYPGFRLDFDYLPQPGEHVKAFGFADGGGEVRIDDAIVTGYRLDKTYVDVDRPFIAGMSGGPVINNRGNVIGYIVEGSKRDNYFYDGAFILLRSLKDTPLAEICGYEHRRIVECTC